MNLHQIAEIIKGIAEDNQTKIKARLKSSYFTRNRKIDFTSLLYFLLNFQKESAQTGLNRFFKLIGKPEIHMSEQAFSKARNHFDHTPFETMMRETVAEQYSGQYDLAEWNGWKVFAIDGTTVALPDKANLCIAFGASGRKKDSATAQVSILYDITNDWIVDAEIGGYMCHETQLAQKHISRMSQLSLTEHSLVIFDRGYPCADLISCLNKNCLHFLMRCHRKWNTQVDETDSPDFQVKLRDHSIIRVIKFKLPSGEMETLITNLFDLSHEAFQQLYFMRWPIESKYDIVKNKLELENFSGYSPNSIRQDFWACMLLANVAAVAKKDADDTVQNIRSDSKNRYHYIPNINQLIGSLKDQFIAACLIPSAPDRAKAIDLIVMEISRAVVPVRPGRSSPRNPWPRKSKFCFNHKSNI